MKKFTLFITLILAFSITAFAEKVTWTGAEDMNWNNPNNWSTGKVPGPDDDVEIPDGTLECLINGPAYVNSVFNKGNIISDKDCSFWVKQDFINEGVIDVPGR